MMEFPVHHKEDLLYSEQNNFYRLLRIQKTVKDFEPMLHYQCGNGAFVRYCRLNGYRVQGFDMKIEAHKRYIKPESVMTMLVVNQFDSLEKLQWHLPYMTEKLMFGGVLIIENPFYDEGWNGLNIGLKWTETLELMKKSGYVHQGNVSMNMPLFANNNNGTKIKRR